MPTLISGERLLHAYQVPTRGVWRQLPPHQLPPDALWDAQNVVVLDGELQPRAGVEEFATLGTPFAGTPTGAILYLSTAGVASPFVGTREEIYRYDVATSTWGNLTGSGVNLTAGDTQLARFTTLVVGTPAVNWLIHVNGADAPRAWNGTGLFAQLQGSPPVFSDIATIADRLVGLVPPFTCRWYNARSVTICPELNFKQMAETPDRVVAIQAVGQVAGIIWKEDSLWTVSPTGQQSDASSFRFDLVGFFEGPAGPGAVVDANGAKVHMTPSGRIGVFTGSRVTWVADGIWPMIRADIRKNQSKRIYGWFNADLDTVTFIYPTHQMAIGSNVMRGRVDLTLPKPEAGVEAYGAFPGLMGVSIRAALPVLWDDNTRDVLLFSAAGESLKVGGTTDDGAAIPGFWRTGLVQTPQADAIRFEALEVYARRGADQGQLTLNPVTSYLLDDDGVVGETLDVPLDGRDLWVRAPARHGRPGALSRDSPRLRRRDDDPRALPGLRALRAEESGLMPFRIPGAPSLDPNRPDFSFQQITTWMNDTRLALESRQAALEGLTLNPDSPLWAGRDLPTVPTLPVDPPTGFQAWGVYDAIQLVWDLDPDPAIEGYELLRDGAIIDLLKANCHTDKPIGDLASHTYELRTVRVGDFVRSAGVTASAAATDDEATIRANHDAAFLGHQTAAMARNAATEVIYGNLSDPAGMFTQSSTPQDTGFSITVTTPGGVPIIIFAQSSGGAGHESRMRTQRRYAVVSIKRDATVIASTPHGNWIPSGDFLERDTSVSSPSRMPARRAPIPIALFYSVERPVGGCEAFG